MGCGVYVMTTFIKDLIPIIRDRLIETQPNFWGDDELVRIAAFGIKDLWRSIVDLKQEHFLTISTDTVTYPANGTELAGLPLDIHKIYMIEPQDPRETSANVGLRFTPLEYNHPFFQQARTMDAVAPASTNVYYSVSGQGGPNAATRILCAPKVTQTVKVAFSYVPVLP